MLGLKLNLVSKWGLRPSAGQRIYLVYIWPWLCGYQCFLVIFVDHITISNTLKPRQNGHRFADDTFKRIFLNENVRISIKISLKFVPSGSIDNIPTLVQVMAWRRPGDKPLSKPMMVRLPTHICVTRPQWVKKYRMSHIRIKLDTVTLFQYDNRSYNIWQNSRKVFWYLK